MVFVGSTSLKYRLVGGTSLNIVQFWFKVQTCRRYQPKILNLCGQVIYLQEVLAQIYSNFSFELGSFQLKITFFRIFKDSREQNLIFSLLPKVKKNFENFFTFYAEKRVINYAFLHINEKVQECDFFQNTMGILQKRLKNFNFRRIIRANSRF